MELETTKLGPNERLLLKVNKIKGIRDKILSTKLEIVDVTMILNAILEELNEISLAYQRNMNNKEILENDNITNDYHEVDLAPNDMQIEGDYSLREPKNSNLKRLNDLIIKINTLDNLDLSEKSLLESIMKKEQNSLQELLSAKMKADVEFQNVFGYSSSEKGNKK